MQTALAFLGTGTMVVLLKQVGSTDMLRERLKMLLKTPASWSAQPLRALPDMTSGPGALRGLIFLKNRFTSATVIVGTPLVGLSGSSAAGGSLSLSKRALVVVLTCSNCCLKFGKVKKKTLKIHTLRNF